MLKKSELESNIIEVLDRIDEACSSVGRKREEITLVAVSKKKSAHEIDTVAEILKEHGISINFGENYLHEYLNKKIAIKNLATWHFIGKLQSNKVKDIVNNFDVIESVSSLKTLSDINSKCTKKLKIYLQVNISRDKNKEGFLEENLLEVIKENNFNDYKNIDIMGLMTITQIYPTNELVRDDFKKMRVLKDKIISNKIYNITELSLSMGMSSDFDIAIEEGADIVRIGSAIFGDRSYSRGALQAP